MNYTNAEFIKSAAVKSDFINDGLPQIAFAGRSNVGKSSVINKIVNRRNFARVSAVPGKTAHINYFLIDKKAYFTDLPGYGYARVSASEKVRWASLMESYFAGGELITLGVLIVDSRHKPTEDDVMMANWFKETGCPLVVVANKSDKLKKSEIEPNMSVIGNTLELGAETKLLLFSAENGNGRSELLAEIEKYVSD